MKPAKLGAEGDFLAGLLDSTSLVVYLKDVEGRYLYVNRRYERLAGVPRERILGKRDHDFFPQETADLFRAQDAEVARRRKALEFEETIPLPGGVLSFLTEKFPLFDGEGKVRATGGFCTEITSQKCRADESLAEERERLAVTLRSVGWGIVAADADGRVILLNPAAAALAGMSATAAEGRGVNEIMRAAGAEHEGFFGRLVQEALSDAAPAPPRDVAVVSAAGERRTIVPSASAVRDRRGEIIGAVLCLRDVTEQRRSDEELYKIRSLESLAFLAGGIAHDFNNHLTAIAASLELLKEELPSSRPARSLLDDAAKICRRATALAQRLSSFAEGEEPLRKAFAPGPLLIETARLVLRGSKVKSRAFVPRGLWSIAGDEAQFTQVLGNLLLNAREAMPGGGTVLLRGENLNLAEPLLHLPAGRYVRLTVRDDGPGIAAALLPRIFDPYCSSKKRGSGLGLAIVHSVVRRHGGHVWAESMDGKGARFTVLIPAAPSARKVSAPRRGRRR